MAKKIALDLSPAEISPAGIGQYTVNLTRHLLELDKENEYYIYTTAPFPNLEYDNIRIHNIVVPFPPNFRARGIRWMMDVNQDLKKRKIDLLISYSNHFFSLIFPNTWQVIYDLGPVKYPKFFPLKARMVYPFTAKMALQKAKLVLVPSKTVKKELLTFAKVPDERIEVFYPARNEAEFATEKTAKPELPANYILTVATLEPRKNLEAGIKAFAKLKLEKRIPEDLKYVIVGKKGWFYKSIFKIVEALGLKDEVLFTGYVGDEWIPEIYQKAKGFVYLSFYEGFGMPPLEAIHQGVPVLLNDIPVFKECFSNLAMFADAGNKDVSGLADELAKLINDNPIYPLNELAKAAGERYSWQLTANKLNELLKASWK
jgi:glycosyltransferase involved in cell wall biosynthesis